MENINLKWTKQMDAYLLANYGRTDSSTIARQLTSFRIAAEQDPKARVTRKDVEDRAEVIGLTNKDLPRGATVPLMKVTALLNASAPTLSVAANPKVQRFFQLLSGVEHGTLAWADERLKEQIAAREQGRI